MRSTTRSTTRSRPAVRRHARCAALVLLAAVLVLPPAAAGATAGDAPAGASPDTASVTLIHGLRDLVADVYLDGQLVLEGFAPQRITDPVPVPAGEREIAVREAGAPPDAPPAVAGTVTLEPGRPYSGIVHPTPSGTPTLSAFVEDASPVPPGQGRLVVRHTAAAGPVDVRTGDAAVATGLQPGGEAVTTRPAGVVTVSVTAPGAPGAPAASVSADVEAQEGAVTALFLVGAAEDDSLLLLRRRIEGMASAPGGVPTGDSGLAVGPNEAATDDTTTVVLTSAALAALAGGLVAALRVALGWRRVRMAGERSA